MRQLLCCGAAVLLGLPAWTQETAKSDTPGASVNGQKISQAAGVERPSLVRLDGGLYSAVIDHSFDESRQPESRHTHWPGKGPFVILCPACKEEFLKSLKEINDHASARIRNSSPALPVAEPDQRVFQFIKSPKDLDTFNGGNPSAPPPGFAAPKAGPGGLDSANAGAPRQGLGGIFSDPQNPQPSDAKIPLGPVDLRVKAASEGPGLEPIKDIIPLQPHR